MKHGPIALISEKCPSVFLAPKGEIFNKIVSSMQEIKARNGPGHRDRHRGMRAARRASPTR